VWLKNPHNCFPLVAKSSVTLRKQLFDVLNQHGIDMIIHSGTFYEVDAVERIIGVADQLINNHIFRQNETLVDGK
jgi:hypothetical protein